MGTSVLTPVTGSEVEQRRAATVPPGTRAGAMSTGARGAFAEWTVEKFREWARAGLDTKALATNRAFVDGDHWQQALGWIGPWPVAAQGATEADMQAITQLQTEIARIFTSRNVIGEVVSRHRGGVLGRMPSWSFAPRAPTYDANGVAVDLTPEQVTAKRELEARLTAWWDRNRVHTLLQEYAQRLLYADRAALRLYVPRNALRTTVVDGRQVSALVVRDFDDALSKIRVMAPEPEVCRVLVDDDTGTDVGVFFTKNDAEQDVVELCFVDGESGRTVLAMRNGDAFDGIALDMGGRLTMVEACRPTFITEQVRQAQRALNYANTMIPRNVTTGGFLEEVIVNAMVPGHWEVIDGHRRYVADPVVRGPGSLQNWRGIELEDAQGNKSITTPNVLWRDPVPPTSSIEAKREHYRDIVEECDQAHVLADADGGVGWQSRVQARADYATSLRDTAAAVDFVGAWLLEAVTALAEALTGNAGQYTREWRAVFACLLDTGPLTPEERQANRDDVSVGLLSRGAGMERGGIADSDAEMARIDDEQTGDLTREEKRATVFKLWIDAGVADEFAARRAGLNDAEVRELQQSRTDVTPPADERTVPPDDGAGDGGGDAGDGGAGGE